MPDIVLAADQTAVTLLLHDAEALFGTKSQDGSGNFGPFFAAYGVSVSFTGGTVVLIAPKTIELDNISLNYSLNLSFGIDLNDFLPNFCIPQVCVDIPCVGKVCTPEICISWPTITFPFSYSDSLSFSADFEVLTQLSGGNWNVEIKILSVPAIDLSVAAAAILAALGLALGAALAVIPLIGPLLAGVVEAILAGIGIAGITGLLGPLLSLILSGLTFTILHPPAVQQVLPASGPHDPAVSIDVIALDCVVQQTDKAELVVSASIAA
jgi:hypothetical protein